VRHSKRLSSKRQNNHQDNLSEISVEKLRDTPVAIVSNPCEVLYRPLDKKSMELQQHIWFTKLEESNNNNNERSSNNAEPLLENLSINTKEEGGNITNADAIVNENQSDKEDEKVNEVLFVLNDIEIKKVIDPDINNNGNYAVLELTEKSMNDLGFDTNRVITPLKLIKDDMKEQASMGKKKNK
jgi:hypothetical protein